MKCPKCGYNSFDHLESCKKCGQDMAVHKARFGLRSLFFGGGKHEPAATSTTVEEAETETPSGDLAAPAAPTDFGFNFMSDEVPDEEPLESSLDELLGGDPSEESESGVFAGQAEPGFELPILDRPAEGSEVSGDVSPDFDFAWEEPSVENGKISDEEGEFGTEPFPEFDQDEFLGGSNGEMDLTLGNPEGFDMEFEAPPLSGGELPEFAVEDEEPAAAMEEPAGISAEETAGEVFASMEKPLLFEDFDPASEDAADQGALPESPDAAEQLSWEDATLGGAEEEESGFPEPNIAELFLESLDETADKKNDAESAPDIYKEFTGTDPFGNFSSEVTLVERECQDPPECRGETGEEESAGSGFSWEEEVEEAYSETVSAPPLTSRIGAGVTDLIILAVVFILFLAAGEVALGSGRGNNLFPSPADLLELAIPYFLVLFAVCFGYFTLFHFLIGQTLGKMLFRIRVVGEEGGGLMFSQAFLRSVGGLLSLLTAGMGYLRIAFDRDRRGWNDRLANSRVVPVTGWENPEGLREDGLAEEGS